MCSLPDSPQFPNIYRKAIPLKSDQVNCWLIFPLVIKLILLCNWLVRPPLGFYCQSGDEKAYISVNAIKSDGFIDLDICSSVETINMPLIESMIFSSNYVNQNRVWILWNWYFLRKKNSSIHTSKINICCATDDRSVYWLALCECVLFCFSYYKSSCLDCLHAICNQTHIKTNSSSLTRGLVSLKTKQQSVRRPEKQVFLNTKAI